jgi:succinoglycan biosynthesis protein ExoA
MARPVVSVIIPCYNEVKTIGLLLEALANQVYALEQIEVLVVDGLSTDGSPEKIAESRRRWPDLSLRMIENPRRVIPSALNLGISKAIGRYIIRLDAHCVPDEHYIMRCVELLEADVADNVGGRWIIAPGADTFAAQAIAAASSHPFGVGDAHYRYAEKAAYVDTVPFGAFRRDLFDQIGLYDDMLLANEDYDLNYRIRRAGGRIYLSPDITTRYYARSSLPALARQFFRYGWWKTRMLRKYPESIRWRQLVPPLFVAAFVGLVFSSILHGLPRLVLWALLASYGALNVYFSALLIRQKRADWRVGLWLPAVFATMHISWGSGFLAGLPGALWKKPRPVRDG